MAKKTSKDVKQAKKAVKPAKKASAAPKTPENASQAVLQFVGQYLKDASFECAVPSFVGNLAQLQFDLQVGVQVTDLSHELKEVTVMLKGVAKNKDNKANYLAETSASAVFHIEGIAPEQYRPMLAIDGAAMVFPLARQALLSSIADGSYPTPPVGPVDFRKLYENSQKPN